MKKLLTIILTFFATTSLVFGASNLWEYYKANNLPFPSFLERKDIFENEIGIEEYRGTASQNNDYLNYLEIPKIKLGAGTFQPFQGGTGISNIPTYGQMLVGNSGGTYTLTATSSLGITAAGDGVSNWNKQTNYGVLNLTASTTIPYWAKDAFYASSTSVFQGLATFGNASTSQISASSGSYLGTVFTGTWNGTAISNAYVDDDITLTNLTQITNRAISDTSGTLAVGRGGTGLTTFTSSQLIYGNGTEALSGVATTSLTATSPLSLSQPISVIGSSASALSISVAGDWTGTIDSNNFAGGAIGVGELIYGGSAGSFSELALGTNGFVLALSNGLPAWVATTTIPLAGDVTGTLSATVVGNDSHDHTSTTISGVDISADTNLTAGRSLTLTDDDVLADAELYTGAITFAVASSSLATTTNFLSHKVSSAITITQVDGHCFNKGTTTVDIEQNGTTIFQTGQFWQGFFVEADGSATTSTAFADATVPANSWLTFDIEGWNVGSPTNCITTIRYTKDD